VTVLKSTEATFILVCAIRIIISYHLPGSMPSGL